MGKRTVVVVKYAYPPSTSGLIAICSSRLEDVLTVTVRDFGPGLPRGTARLVGFAANGLAGVTKPPS
jgi:anti-sigma regulatory factor (Ser/Thr protein kinase)